MSGAPACFSWAPFVRLSCEDVTDRRRLASVSTRRQLATADTRQKQDTCIIIPPTHLTTKTAAATHLPLCTNCTRAETRGEDYPFFASRRSWLINLTEREPPSGWEVAQSSSLGGHTGLHCLSKELPSSRRSLPGSRAGARRRGVQLSPI